MSPNFLEMSIKKHVQLLGNADLKSSVFQRSSFPVKREWSIKTKTEWTFFFNFLGVHLQACDTCWRTQAEF